MRLEPVEDIAGEGIVFDPKGNEVGPARYEIEIFQEMLAAPTTDDPHGEVRGLKQISGFIEGLDNFDLVGKPLVLHLADGRRWEFWIQNQDGHAVNRGKGLYLP